MKENCMKTAISIDDELFQKAEALSSKLHLSRSQLFSQALEYMIERSETLGIIQKLNEVYGQGEVEVSPLIKASKKKMKKNLDKW